MKNRYALPLISLLAVFAGLVLQSLPVTRPFALKSTDLQFKLFADPAKASRNIVVIEVDQDSLDHFEKDNVPWPWPRSLYRPLIEYCARGGATAIMFDILFNNISPYGEYTDREFAAAIKKAGNVYLAAMFSARPQRDAKGLEARFTIPFSGRAPAAIWKQPASLPLPKILAATAGIGSITHGPDPDGVYRRIQPFTRVDNRLVPALFAAPFADPRMNTRWTADGIDVGNLRIPTDDNGAMWINYHGNRGVYRRYSAAAVISSALMEQAGLTPPVPKEVFKDAYVLIGYTAPGLYDLKPTPLSSVSPALEIHAAALDNLINQDFLTGASPLTTAVIALLGAIAISAGVLLLPATAASAAVFAATVAGLLIISGLSFHLGVLLDLATLGTSALFALVGAAVFRYQTEGKRRRFIANAFGHYVSPKVVKRILDDPAKLSLGGEKKEITVFFSDLEGFTSISERLEPHELVDLLNAYTTMIAEVITLYDGTLDKYIGDAVMAFWGAPIDQADQAGTSLLAGLECQERMKGFAQKARNRGVPELSMRIGVNSGECVVGNMGAQGRFDYTVIGDAVNQASRLEGLNKAYGTKILATGSTWRAAEGVVFGRLIDYLKVKGKNVPVRVYEIMAAAGKETEHMRFLKEQYEQALEAHRNRCWKDTVRITASILRRADDGPATVLLERAQAYLQAPPPKNWDGVYVHTNK